MNKKPGRIPPEPSKPITPNRRKPITPKLSKPITPNRRKPITPKLSKPITPNPVTTERRPPVIIDRPITKWTQDIKPTTKWPPFVKSTTESSLIWPTTEKSTSKSPFPWYPETEIDRLSADFRTVKPTMHLWDWSEWRRTTTSRRPTYTPIPSNNGYGDHSLTTIVIALCGSLLALCVVCVFITTIRRIFGNRNATSHESEIPVAADNTDRASNSSPVDDKPPDYNELFHDSNLTGYPSAPAHWPLPPSYTTAVESKTMRRTTSVIEEEASNGIYVVTLSGMGHRNLSYVPEETNSNL